VPVFPGGHSEVLYYTVLYCREGTVLYCTAEQGLYCTVLHCIVLYCIEHHLATWGVPNVPVFPGGPSEVRPTATHCSAGTVQSSNLFF